MFEVLQLYKPILVLGKNIYTFPFYIFLQIQSDQETIVFFSKVIM